MDKSKREKAHRAPITTVETQKLGKESHVLVPLQKDPKIEATKPFKRTQENVSTLMSAGRPEALTADEIAKSSTQLRINRIKEKIDDINEAEYMTTYGESFKNAYSLTYRGLSLTIIGYTVGNIMWMGIPKYAASLGAAAALPFGQVVAVLGITLAVYFVGIPATVATIWTGLRFAANKLNKFRLQGNLAYEQKKLKRLT